MPCWAYYPKQDMGDREKPEEYYLHINDIIDYMSKSPLLSAIVKKIKYITNIEEEFIVDFILLSGLFHDIGKTIIHYQKNPVNFSGHEVASMVFVYHALIKIGLLKSNDIIKKLMESSNTGKKELYAALTLVPIFLHHYAFGNFNERIKKGLELVNNKDDFRIYDDCKDEIEKTLKYINEIIKSEEAIKVIKAAKELITTNDLHIVIHKLDDQVEKDLPYLSSDSINLRIASTVLSLLNEADGRVSIKNRRRNPK
ncbi:CRISPR-associated HD domain-containing protein [Caldivirga maquilingensis]|uniref:CRISPR-associated HD domain protein n=1 Tax=Caldivirga maquilingensis (strain ATCC 700844 / DSM 13496 / JCM 10307 / IC-167) TaxID=397948 RepID=A8M9D1_CALMQ|nr:CRISPR-associated HD domain-containing protein [Caldivirga maquilingensis]ABW02350.1 CRISPR-associated HD domain protein [Caldivirga maquilingensis IC-167]